MIPALYLVAALFLEPAEVEIVAPAAPTLAETFASQVQPILVATLVAAAIALAGFASYAIKVLIGRGKIWLDGLATSAAWRAANAKLELAARAGVEAAEQTLARQLKAIEPIGKLDPLQAGQVLRAAVEAARAHFGPATWADIGAAMEKSTGDLAELLRHKIEAAVFRSKAASSPAVVGTIVETDGSTSRTMTVSASSSADPSPEASTVREQVDPIGAGDSGPVG
jgi:hypothetical protein